MKRILFLFIAVLALAISVPAWAESIDLATAQRAAMDYVRTRNGSGQFRSVMPMQLWTHAEPSTLNPHDAAYYVVNTDQGFVIVAGDDRARTILAYGDNPLTEVEDLPSGARYWLDLYRRQIEALQSQPGVNVPEQRLRSSLYHPAVSISPLLHSLWGQSSPFNRLCPTVGNSYCYAGCSAVALAQVMRYWQYPAQSDSLPAYTTRSLEIEVPALDGTSFDWSNMLDNYPVLGGYSADQQTAVATLLRYVGQAEHMDYKTQGSDADEYNILNAIKFFGYDQTACFVEKSSIEGEEYYADNIWTAMLWNELKMGRPVIYCAYTMEADSTLTGHAFNVDGYNADDDTYHVNFGWRGTGDGYYALNAFVLGGYQFDIGQLMFLNVMPARPQPVLWVNKEQVDLTCHVGETATQRIIVAGTDLVADIIATLADADEAFTLDVAQVMAGNTVYTVTFAPQEYGDHSALLTLSSRGAEDAVVVINGNVFALGDANHDGRVDINDVTWLIDALLVPAIEACPICADLDGNGLVDITDLVLLIDKILLAN